MAIDIPQQGPRVALDALPGVRRQVRDTTGEALADLGQGVARLAGAAGDIARKVKKEQDAAALHEAFTALGTTKQQLLEDQANGFLTAQKGKQAGENRDSVLSFYETTAERIRERLSDDQRAAFDEIYDREFLALTSTVDRHVAREADEYAKQQLEGALAIAASDAVGAAARGEMDRVDDALGNGMGALDARAAAADWEPDFADAQRLAFTTQAHLGVVGKLLETGDTAGAKTYLDFKRGEIDEGVLAKSGIEKKLAAAGKNDEAREIAESAWHSADGDPLQAAELVRARGIKDTEVFDEVMQRIQQRGNFEAAARRQNDVEPLGRLMQQLMTTGNFSTTDPNGDFAKLSDDGKGEILARREARRRSLLSENRREKREQDALDRSAYLEFLALKPFGEPGNDQSSVDIGARWKGVAPDGINRMIAHQNKVNEEGEKGRGDTLQEFRAQAMNRAKAAGLSDEDTKEFWANVQERYFEQFQDPANEGKKTLAPELSRRILDDALMYGTVPGKVWGTNPRRRYKAERAGEAFTPNPQEPSAAPPPRPSTSVPEADRALIIDAFRRKGITPTEEQILATYRKRNPGG